LNFSCVWYIISGMKNISIDSKILILLVLLSLFIPVEGVYAASKQRIALQPFGHVDKKAIESAVSGIKRACDKMEIEVRPSIPLPASAFYKPRNRYRAELLTGYIDAYYRKYFDRQYAMVVGITSKDISTTKDNYEDWGIFGLAYLDTGPAVVSVYRLNRNAKSQRHFMERIWKVVMHEVGHIFGLEHCTTKGCEMEDAKGTIKTVDNSSGEFCQRCREIVARRCR
jgi:archaemetzincin